MGRLWATSGLLEPIDRQLAALKAGKMEAAYEETSQAFREATPLDRFTAFVDANPILKDAAEHTFPAARSKTASARSAAR